MHGEGLKWGKAIGWFVAAYAAVTIVATGFCIMVALAMQAPPTASPVESPAYIFAQRFLPLINLLVWTAFAALYFRGRAASATNREARKLGALWVMAAALVDFFLFVKTKTPISLSPHDFYVGQWPWLYLIYLAVALAPLCWLGLASRLRGRTAADPGAIRP